MPYKPSFQSQNPISIHEISPPRSEAALNISSLYTAPSLRATLLSQVSVSPFVETRFSVTSAAQPLPNQAQTFGVRFPLPENEKVPPIIDFSADVYVAYSHGGTELTSEFSVLGIFGRYSPTRELVGYHHFTGMDTLSGDLKPFRVCSLNQRYIIADFGVGIDHDADFTEYFFGIVLINEHQTLPGSFIATGNLSVRAHESALPVVDPQR